MAKGKRGKRGSGKATKPELKEQLAKTVSNLHAAERKRARAHERAIAAEASAEKLVETLQVEVIICVRACLTCMPYVCAWNKYAMCECALYASRVCLMCVPYTCALYVCLMPYTYSLCLSLSLPPPSVSLCLTHVQYFVVNDETGFSCPDTGKSVTARELIAADLKRVGGHFAELLRFRQVHAMPSHVYARMYARAHAHMHVRTHL
jgi:hypothetical protein